MPTGSRNKELYRGLFFGTVLSLVFWIPLVLWITT
jgi:hypothetical protein